MRLVVSLAALAVLGCVPQTADLAADTMPPESRDSARVFHFGHSLANWFYDDDPDGVYAVGTWTMDFARDAGLEGCADGMWPGGLYPSVFAFFREEWTDAHSHELSCWQGDWESSEYDLAVITENNFSWREGVTDERIDAAEDLISRIRSRAPEIQIALYAHWPEWSDYSQSAMDGWLSETAEGYSEFQRRLYAGIESKTGLDLLYIPTGEALAALMSGPLSEMTYADFAVDDAPHGTETTYFLAGLTHFMAIYGRKPDSGYAPPDRIHPLVRERWAEVVETAWIVVSQRD